MSCIAVHCCLYNTHAYKFCTIRYKQRGQTTGRKEKTEGYLLQDDQELGLLDEETGQQLPQTANSGRLEPRDAILLDDAGGESCNGEGEDETAPLLGKTAKKKSRDRKSKRERDDETKWDKERERGGKAREKTLKGSKREKGERSNKGQGERTPTDAGKPETRDMVVAERKEEVPRDTDKPEQDTEMTVKERKGGEEKDFDGESRAAKEKGQLKGADNLGEREVTATKKKKDGQKGSDKPEIKDRGEEKDNNLARAKVKGEKVKHSNLGDTSDTAEVRDGEKIKEGVKEGLNEAAPLAESETKETAKERKRGGPIESSQTETKDKKERVKERGKGDTEKAQIEKLKNTGPRGAEELEEVGREEERKRGVSRDNDKGEAKTEEETTTRRKKKDKNTSAIKERGAEAEDGEGKMKEKKRGDKEKKRRSREKDNL